MTDQNGALAGIKVLDLTDERGIYGVKLLADLGADVVRPEPLSGDPLRKRGPLHGAESLWHAYFASNRRFVALDPVTEQGQSLLDRMVAATDVVVTCANAFCVNEANVAAALKRRPNLVVIDVSSFGDSGPWKDYLAPDLVAGALGGAVATTGDIETPPLKSFGELNFMVSGAYVAIAALSAMLWVKNGGEGQRVGVSVHECITSCLEHVLMWYCYVDKLPSATSRHLPRRGSLHWSNAYKVMNAATGSIMVTPAPDFEAQIFWLVEQDAQKDLIDPKYLEPENLPLMVQRLMEVLHGWVATKDAEALFEEAQERHAPYGWVLPVDKLASNPQLDARDWWVDYELDNGAIQGPGAPYQFSSTPWRIKAKEAAVPQTAAARLLADIGWVEHGEAS